MRFISIVITISKFRDIEAASVALMPPPFSPGPDRWEDPGLFSPRGKSSISSPRSASTHGGSPDSSPTPAPSQRGALFSPRSLGFPVITQTAPSLANYRSGSAVHKPIVRFDHATRDEVNEFLQFYGDSEDGQFGLSRGYLPNLKSGRLQLIPGGVLSAQEQNELIHLDYKTPIYKKKNTGVYRIAGHLKKVIKYHAYCFDPMDDPYDAIVVEAYFMNRLATQDPGLTLKVDFYSGSVSTPPALLPGEVPKILDMTCFDGKPPHIRYMIMDEVGPSLVQYMLTRPDGRIDFLEAMRLGKQMIQLLQRLHHLNIIHGDAHWGNFAFELDPPLSKLILIDFGRSQFVEEGATEPPRWKGCDYLHPYTALWEMDSCRVSFRDDVYRTVQMTAMSIYGMIHYQILETMLKEPDSRAPEDDWAKHRARVRSYREMKEKADFWELGDDLKLESINLSVNAGRIRPHLMKISSLIVDPPTHYSKPDYDGIIAEYDAIIAILSLPEAD